MLKSQLKCTISLFLTEPVELVGMLKSQPNARYLILVPVELVGMLKSQLNARYLNSH
jgi:hypothetical protein